MNIIELQNAAFDLAEDMGLSYRLMDQRQKEFFYKLAEVVEQRAEARAHELAAELEPEA